MEGLEAYQHWENTGRGLPEEAHKFIPKYRFIKRFLKKCRRKNGIPDINYNHIEEVVVIGHGIEADRAFLDQIMKACKKVRNVILFVYDGEQNESIERKRNFFENRGVNVELVAY